MRNEGPTDLSIADSIVDTMFNAGVDRIFFTSGSDITFFQESVAKREFSGIPGPRIVSMSHEIVALNAALGYSAMSGRPTACAVHVDVGTLNYGAGLHSAMHARLPVLLTAGTPPVSMPGTRLGARDGAHFWTQQVPDQNGIVRQYMKWEHRLAYQDDASAVVSRALQVALSEPPGPVYLSIPREVALLEDSKSSGLQVADLAIPEVAVPSEASIRWALERLAKAENPVVVIGRGGRISEACQLLNSFVSDFGVTVVDGTFVSYQAIALDHPLYRRRADLSLADLVIVLECDVPWFPGPRAPRIGSDIVVVDPDPIATKMVLTEFPAKKRIVSATSEFLRALSSLADAMWSHEEWEFARARAERAKTLVERERITIADEVASKKASDDDSVIDPLWAAAEVGTWLAASEWVVLDDTGNTSTPVRQFLDAEGPARYFRHPSTAGGWGPGAAVGMKLARPDLDIALVSGEGFYMFGVPGAALLAALEHDAPFLAVIFQNDSYNTGTAETARHFPGGYAQRAGFPGGYLTVSPDLAAECEAFGGFGRNVFHGGQIRSALEDASKAVRDGRPAVVSIRLPRLLEDATRVSGAVTTSDALLAS